MGIMRRRRAWGGPYREEMNDRSEAWGKGLWLFLSRTQNSRFMQVITQWASSEICLDTASLATRMEAVW